MAYSWPVVGHLPQLWRHGVVGFLQRESQRTGADAFVIHSGAKRLYVARHPDQIARVLIPQHHEFERDTSATVELFGDGLLALTGEEWHTRRRLLGPYFRKHVMPDFTADITAEAEALCARWHTTAGAPFKPTRDLSWMMLSILGKCVFSFTFDRDKHSGSAMHQALIVLTKDAMFRIFAPLPRWVVYRSRAVREARDVVRAVATEIVETARQQWHTGQAAPTMRALLQAQADGVLRTQDVIGEVVTLLVAGHETSATGMAWLLATLAEHSDLRERCRAEVMRHNASPLLTSVIKETLRLYPPVPLSIHRALQDTHLGPLPVPRGAQVLVASLLTHRDPLLWSNPETFDAERFMPERTELRHKFQYLPFLLGPHICLGMHLALLEMQIAAEHILRNFSIETVQAAVPDLRVSLHPLHFRMRVTPASVTRVHHRKSA